MQINIEDMLNEVAVTVLSPETIGPMIQKSFTSALESAISSAMGHNSEFRKTLNEKIAEALPGQLEGVSMISTLIRERVLTAISEQQETAITQLIGNQLDDLMSKVPANMKLSDLFTELSARYGGRDYERPEGDHPTFIVDRCERWTNVYIDKNESADKGECAIEVTISHHNSSIQSLRVLERDYTTKKYVSRVWNDELYLTRLFAGGTVFELDTSTGDIGAEFYYN